jgi:hypothetical protein
VGHSTRTKRLSSLTGLDAANHIRASGGGRKMFLTSPLIEQAITLVDVSAAPRRVANSSMVEAQESMLTAILRNGSNAVN